MPTKFYTNLSLVCQRWNSLIEERHFFSSRLFTKVRSKEMYELAVKSNRKVDLLIIVSQSSTDHIKYIKKILEKPNNWVGKACLLLRNDSNTFNLNLVIDYLKCVQNLEVLYLNFHRLFFDKIFDIIEPIEFNNLSFLSITDCSHDVVRKCLFAFKTPGNFASLIYPVRKYLNLLFTVLKHFKISSNHHQHSECENIFKFINRNSSQLEDCELNMNFCNFKWTPDSLDLR